MQFGGFSVQTAQLSFWLRDETLDFASISEYFFFYWLEIRFSSLRFLIPKETSEFTKEGLETKSKPIPKRRYQQGPATKILRYAFS